MHNTTVNAHSTASTIGSSSGTAIDTARAAPPPAAAAAAAPADNADRGHEYHSDALGVIMANSWRRQRSFKPTEISSQKPEGFEWGLCHEDAGVLRSA